MTADTQTWGRPTGVTSLLQARHPRAPTVTKQRDRWAFLRRQINQLGHKSGCRSSNATSAWQQQYSRPPRGSDPSLTCSPAPLSINHTLSDNVKGYTFQANKDNAAKNAGVKPHVTGCYQAGQIRLCPANSHISPLPPPVRGGRVKEMKGQGLCLAQPNLLFGHIIIKEGGWGASLKKTRVPFTLISLNCSKTGWKTKSSPHAHVHYLPGSQNNSHCIQARDNRPKINRPKQAVPQINEG